jgi:hypothetical protein
MSTLGSSAPGSGIFKSKSTKSKKAKATEAEPGMESFEVNTGSPDPPCGVGRARRAGPAAGVVDLAIEMRARPCPRLPRRAAARGGRMR